MFNLNSIDGAVKFANVLQAKDIEIGENANGKFIKFPNGLLICISVITKTNINLDKQWGSFYESSFITIGEFPCNFKSIFYSDASVIKGDDALSSAFSMSPIAGLANWSTIKLFRPTATYGATFGIKCIAIGTWK